MKETMKEQKIRWNISKALSCVYRSLLKSKLKIKESKDYKTAIEHLQSLYHLSLTQIWILSYVCERYLESDDSTGMKNLGPFLDVPVMQIMNWKKDVQILINKGYLEWQKQNVYFQPTEDFIDTLYNNTSFISAENKEFDETDFLNIFAELYENRRSENIPAFRSQRQLHILEDNFEKLPMVKRARAEIDNSLNRFLIYDVCHDVLKGYDSNLNETICDLYDGSMRYDTASQMLEGKHELFTEGLLEFTKKGNLSEAQITLSSKGKKLLLADKAFLFEDTINEKNLIKTDDIKEKALFYSPENQHEIDRLKNALQEDTLKNIQKRLESEGLPIGVAILLYGAPGTGKTESVMQIAKVTGRSIVHVDISESKSAWFGESEKRIKKIFTSYKNACEICEKKGEKMPILLFNEADALISKRKSDTSGNCAQTENAIQNIILEELENLKGIFIATTNLATNMDAAFERRFLFKIKFENPSVEAKTSIWMDKLSWIDKNAANEFAEKYDFSGGQIDNIVRKIAMNEVITGERPDLAEIHSMCNCEKIDSNEHAKKIGFGL